MNTIPSYLTNICQTTITGNGDSDRHQMTLLAIALNLKAVDILEVGVRHGASTLPLLVAAKILNGALISVDILDTDFSCPPDLSDHWTFYKIDALEYLQNCEQKFDLIYLDDWHSYDHVRQELVEIDRLTKPSGLVLVHDLMYSTSPNYHCDLTLQSGQWAHGGPYRAVAELDQNFWEFATIPSCNGLTILRKKYSSKYNQTTSNNSTQQERQT
jgi:predicted O-methyltransferase YrrM